MTVMRKRVRSYEEPEKDVANGPQYNPDINPIIMGQEKDARYAGHMLYVPG